jgi:hypothetical protein
MKPGNGSAFETSLTFRHVQPPVKKAGATKDRAAKKDAASLSQSR